MNRRLSTIAREINESDLGLTAFIVPGYCNTDRKVGRLRHPGKGRTGNRLIVKDAEGKLLLDHNSAETYRTNAEVEEWWARYQEEHRCS